MNARMILFLCGCGEGAYRRGGDLPSVPACYRASGCDHACRDAGHERKRCGAIIEAGRIFGTIAAWPSTWRPASSGSIPP